MSDSPPSIMTEIGSRAPEFQIRGYSLSELSEQASITDLTALLLYGELSSTEMAADLQCRIEEIPSVDASVQERVMSLPWHLSLHEAFRFALLELSQFNEQQDAPHIEASIDRCLQLQKQLLQLMAIRYCSSEGVPLPAVPSTLDLIDQFLLSFRGVPAELVEQQVVSAILLLFATDPECPSDLACRAVASTEGELGSALLAASSASRIPQIVCETEAVYRFLDEIDCEADIDLMLERINSGDVSPPAMVLKDSAQVDPRSDILNAHCCALADDRQQSGFEALAKQIENACPNYQTTVAWPLARLFHYLGLEHELLGPLLQVARLPAWTAHYLEQFGQPLHCSWKYVGPKKRSLEKDMLFD